MNKYQNFRVKEGQEVVYKSFISETKKLEDGVYEVLGSKEIVDRDGDIVKIDGINLKSFKQHSPILFSHNPSLGKIGKSIKTWKKGNELWFRPKLLGPEANSSEANFVRYVLDNGFGGAWSIGFRPNWEKTKRNEKGGGWIFNESELLELSYVEIPSNPAAISKSINEAIDEGIIDEVEGKHIELSIKEYLDKFFKLFENTDKETETETKDDEDDEILNLTNQIEEDELETTIKNIEKLLNEDEGDELNKKPEQTTNRDHNLHICKSCGCELECPVCSEETKIYDWIFEKLNEKDNKTEAQIILDELNK